MIKYYMNVEKRTELGRAIYRQLWHNLNKVERRVQASAVGGAGCKHFYEKIFNPDMLQKLSKMTGDQYAAWGSQIRIEDPGFTDSDDYVFSGGKNYWIGVNR